MKWFTKDYVKEEIFNPAYAASPKGQTLQAQINEMKEAIEELKKEIDMLKQN